MFATTHSRHSMLLAVLAIVVIVAPTANAAPRSPLQAEVVRLRKALVAERGTRVQFASRLKYANQQLAVAITERDAARAERDTLTRDLAGARSELGATTTDRDALRTAMTGSLSQQAAVLTNDQIWLLVWDLVIAFESDCKWDDSTFVGSNYSSVSFNRTSGLC